MGFMKSLKKAASFTPFTGFSGVWAPGLLGENKKKQYGGGPSGPSPIEVQRERFAEQQRLQQPMIDIGQNALQGFGDYRQTPEFDQRLAQGTRTMNRGSAAGGMFDSSNANEGMAGFVNNLTGDELNRQYQQKLNAVKIGHGATTAIGNAASAFGNNAASIYGTQGNVASQNALNSGQQAADMWGMAGNALSGLGSYAGQGGFGGGGTGVASTGLGNVNIDTSFSGMPLQTSQFYGQ